MRILLSTLICIFFNLSLFSQTEKKPEVPKRVYTTQYISPEKAPVMDGLLNDAAWEKVTWDSDFIENEPDENTAPTFQTKFKILYDDKNLYVGIFSLDNAADSIISRLSRRDGFIGDRVNVLIDSYHDKRTGFIFTTTAAGVKGDEIATDNGDNIDDSWNPVWYTKASINDQGWVAEMKIPLSQLRFGKSKSQVWGLNVVRRIDRIQETSLWQRIPVDAAGFVSESGELHGLIDIKPQQQLEIQPFTVLQADTFPAEDGNPFRDGSDFKVNGGIDAKIGITNDLTLDLTVNPDFGQVEADPSAIALDGFQIFFNEQRPFFVENKNIFDYSFDNFSADNVFYSRRIGRNPQGFPNIAAGEFVSNPQNTTILGAAKLSGKTKKGWSIGILESVTAKEFAEVDNNGTRREELVEPLTNYLVGRVQKDFNENNSYIGGIFTATNRKIEENLDFLRKAAYTGGLDFKHQWKNRKYYLQGNFIASRVEGSEMSIANTQTSLTHLFNRVDASHVSVDPSRTSLTGSGGKIEIGKASTGHWRYSGGFTWKSPELELNDIGFLRQADEMRQYARINYRSLKPFGKFRSIWINSDMFTTYDFDGNYNRIQYRLNSYAEFKNNWGIDLGFIHKPRIFTNTILRGGPRYRFSEENINFFFINTNRSKKFRFFGGYVYSQAKENNFSFLRFEAGLTYQPTNALSLAFIPEYTKAPSKTQYVTERNFNSSPRYILASIDQQTLSASIRLNYTINPNLTIQYYGQPFISRGNYDTFKYVTNPVADKLNDRFDVYSADQITFNEASQSYMVDENTNGFTDYEFGKPDFAFVQFRSNLVLRWEYIPGSEVFLVWSQGVTGFGNPEDHLLRSLDEQILGADKNNTFLIKATYRFIL